jgi:hypothetical protein
MNLSRRLAKLERAEARKEVRFVVRFEGPGSEGMQQPTEEEMMKVNKNLIARIWKEADLKPHRLERRPTIRSLNRRQRPLLGARHVPSLELRTASRSSGCPNAS